MTRLDFARHSILQAPTPSIHQGVYCVASGEADGAARSPREQYRGFFSCRLIASIQKDSFQDFTCFACDPALLFILQRRKGFLRRWKEGRKETGEGEGIATAGASQTIFKGAQLLLFLFDNDHSLGMTQ
ncbi:hypothetical protein AVEN_221282-1 [Araneus ventricosus]|uniref:Uncharacterized protein n=1 Tax=Araneus ventricosus TaxID=182803 RepID=A0A4Y2B1U4_ARAVE|nr:hypothetical protein AVEN_221282-1 [Araneus ventricosus]